MIVAFLYDSVKAYVAPRRLGKVLFSPLKVRLWEGKFREPDIVFMRAEHADRRGDQYWRGADLVMEVVSPDDPDRDWVKKQSEYAQAGIAEYWIVDPRDATITVFTLSQNAQTYAVAGKYARGEQAASVLLPDLTVDVEQAFAQG
jgi:Uma2 family endonuclease